VPTARAVRSNPIRPLKKVSQRLSRKVEPEGGPKAFPNPSGFPKWPFYKGVWPSGPGRLCPRGKKAFQDSLPGEWYPR